MSVKARTRLLSLSAAAMGVSVATSQICLAQLPGQSFQPINQVGRFFGFGLSDGYSECPTPKSESGRLTAKLSSFHHEGRQSSQAGNGQIQLYGTPSYAGPIQLPGLVTPHFGPASPVQQYHEGTLGNSFGQPCPCADCQRIRQFEQNSAANLPPFSPAQDMFAPLPGSPPRVLHSTPQNSNPQSNLPLDQSSLPPITPVAPPRATPTTPELIPPAPIDRSSSSRRQSPSDSLLEDETPFDAYDNNKKNSGGKPLLPANPGQRVAPEDSEPYFEPIPPKNQNKSDASEFDEDDLLMIPDQARRYNYAPRLMRQATLPTDSRYAPGPVNRYVR